MQNFLNSPPGPLGSAGQTGTSTTPTNLFNNAGSGGYGNSALQAIRGLSGDENNPLAMNPLKNLFGPGGLLGHLFGGDGSMLGGLFGKQGLGGIPGNLAQIPGNLAQIPQNLSSIFNNQQPQGQPQGIAPTGPSVSSMPTAPTGASTGGSSSPFGHFGGGFLSRFMQNNG